jgi:hypothetical protein
MSAAHKLSLLHRPALLVGGDLVMGLAAVVLGFAAHGTLHAGAASRMLVTWVPFSMAWLALAWPAGLFRPEIAASGRALWRPPLVAMVAAVPGAWLRGLWIGAAPVPAFVAVMAVVTALLYSAWRFAAWAALRHGRPA